MQDQAEIIDFSDNDIKILENFPKMLRLTTLLLTSNSISRISSNSVLASNLPNLKALILTNNKISSFSEIYNIANFKKLEVLSLLDNTVSLSANYKRYIVVKMPSVKILDFVRITKKDRESAEQWSKSKEGKAFIAQVQADAITYNAANQSNSTSTADAVLPGHLSMVVAPSIQAPSASAAAGESGRKARRAYTESERLQIQRAIESASAEQMDVIERQLKVG